MIDANQARNKSSDAVHNGCPMLGIIYASIELACMKGKTHVFVKGESYYNGGELIERRLNVLRSKGFNVKKDVILGGVYGLTIWWGDEE